MRVDHCKRLLLKGQWVDRSLLNRLKPPPALAFNTAPRENAFLVSMFYFAHLGETPSADDRDSRTIVAISCHEYGRSSFSA